jgi:hypothetical protein
LPHAALRRPGPIEKLCQSPDANVSTDKHCAPADAAY